MSYRSPMINPSAPAPPSYVQPTPAAATSQNNSTVAGQPIDPPPPYTPNPPSFSYSHIVPESGQNYQRCEGASNPVELVTVCHVGPEPYMVLCPRCDQLVTTVTNPKPGVLTLLSAGLCFLFCFICTLLPFCVAELQDVEHRCPKCNCHLGTFRRI